MTEAQVVDAGGTRPAPATIIAAAIVLFIGGLFVLVIAGVMVYLTVQLLGGHGDSLSRSVGIMFLPVFLLILMFILVLAGCIVLTGWLILKRRNGARWTAIVLFGFFALSVLGQGSTGPQSTPAGKALQALLLALVPILLLLPPTAHDFRNAKARRVALRMPAPVYPPSPPGYPPPPPPPPPASGAHTPP